MARCFEAWNAREPSEPARAVATAWTPQGGCTDPLADVRGHEGIVAVVAAAQARFSWELVREADGSAPAAGSDVITLDAEGRIMSVLGFLDRVPAQT
ncbi:nuclear transport factor 2 family protein [Streptomyces sp. DT2A-34]|uniref:nuclear transport factor 2 family protein n=1 Tax=Streptomyces sp. DT2A-34 TaxID=3051182 RepID=UPI00265C28F6|nr:nuclear transport factor 2 family protein [Streptomyces sp. DT2A-34]MDO0917612.1 nuclear transport factor 2 family protein [Streptomyces sp. DT2A-34]